MAEATPELIRPPRGAHPLCADVSRAHAEPLSATASRVDHWILVEYRHLWSRDPIGGSGLPDEAKTHLRAQLRALPNARLLFVRRPGRHQPDSFSVFFGRSLEQDRRFFRTEIESYGDLPLLDFAAALAGEPAAARAEPLAHPLLVVCTHGKRDRCCAKYGRPLYDEVAAEAEAGWAWQSTHVGGDRFAGNLVCLPEGLFFGRVERRDVWALLDEYLGGRIDLARYRGRSCYGFATQAAERQVREASGRAGIDDLRLDGTERTADDAWRVRFRVEPDELHEVDVVTRLADEATHLTCSSRAPQRPRRHLATGHRVLS